MKWYGVKKGRSGEPKVFNNWEDCKKEIHGFSGAVYKSFIQESDARVYAFSGVEDRVIDLNTGYVFYVDGSYSDSVNAIGFGVVILKDGKVIDTIKGSSTKEEYLVHNNVSGEILATNRAFKYALENKLEEITICYDYLGIQMFANGSWAPKYNLTKTYSKIGLSISKLLKLNFVKIKAHSGDVFNEMADKLAKSAIGIN